jgi:exopolysaccharide production protein ExoY
MEKNPVKIQRRRRPHTKPVPTREERFASWVSADIQPLGISSVRAFTKRLFDISFSLFALTLSIPIWLIIPLAIRLTSSGPALYKAKRVGQGGRIIYCYKFRSMYKDADVRLEKLLSSDKAIKQEWETHWKLKNDPRITPIGNFIRKTSIDEVPQFINSLIGDLSVVGPRPRVEKELESLPISHVARLLQLKPGITGLWQTSGRSEVDLKKRMELDEHYIEIQGFFYDLFLILKTIPAALFSKGAC